MFNDFVNTYKLSGCKEKAKVVKNKNCKNHLII